MANKEKWIITWNAGYGDNSEVVKAASENDAESMAYEAAREEFENNAEYSAQPYSKELAVELGIEDEDEENEE
jgi:hypothetical protein